MSSIGNEPASQAPVIALSHTSLRVLFILASLLCLTPYVSPPIALFSGIIFANVFGHPFMRYNGKATKWLLQVSVVGLGFGMNVYSAMKAGEQGVVFTVISILGTLLLGFGLGKALSIERKTSHLISTGTAICGGSAIAAVAPIIDASEKQISVAMGTVFILNSIALFLFPAIGHMLHLTESQFGLWAAIAIHDTSSVVGAAKSYGPKALEIATTVKLARALWIIPVSLGTALFLKQGSGKIKIPWFIGFFIIAMTVNTFLPMIATVAKVIVAGAKAGLTLTLFLIGSGLSAGIIRQVGFKPLIQGVILWIAISVAALAAVLHFA